MSRMPKILIAVNLGVIVVLLILYPHLMIAPGKLIPAHAHLSTDCLSCHTPFHGATSERCISCHTPSDIGRLSTTGQLISKPLTAVLFHQKLIAQNCVGCHSDHSGVRRFRMEGRFNHALLQDESRKQCQSCHKSPVDQLHQQITGNCAQCHGMERWAPATFEHNKYFVLDRDHTTSCVTCHVRNDYTNYTCYGCHAHSPASIRNEHLEEGIRNFKNCVECHRSANEDDISNVNGGGRKDGED
jgi:hypothetical protein